MGPGFVILFWLVVLAVLGALWLALAVAAYFGWKKKIGWLKWVAGIPAALMVFVGVLVGGFLALGVIASMNPSSVFKETFGVPASAATSDIRSSVFWFADTGSVYLRFRTSREEFRKLVPADLVAKSANEAKAVLPIEGGPHPDWWSFRYAQEWDYFVRAKTDHDGPGKRGFYSESEYMAYDPSTGFAYYRYLGID